jgi:hypothetical protein
MRAEQAKPDDVVIDRQGKVWQRGAQDSPVVWSTFDGPVMYFGPWLPSYGPQGDLVLLARGGRPVVHHKEGEFVITPVSADTVAEAEQQ